MRNRPTQHLGVALADHRGKPVFINVWESRCPGCIAEAENLRRFAADHPKHR